MLTILLRRLDYHVRPRLRRETCKGCWRENPLGFSVPDGVWRAAVPTRHRSHVLCLLCFDSYATRRGVDWLQGGCEFYPVPGATSSCPPSPSPSTRYRTRPKSASSTTCRSRTSDRSSSSDTHATCRNRASCAMVRLWAWLSLLGLRRRWRDTKRLVTNRTSVGVAPDVMRAARLSHPTTLGSSQHSARAGGVIAARVDGSEPDGLQASNDPLPQRDNSRYK